MTPAFRLCDEYVRRRAELDPVAAAEAGLRVPFTAATDYGPAGIAARAGLLTATLAALDDTPSTSPHDDVAIAFLRERLAAESAWYESGEPFRLLRAQFGLTSSIRDSVDLLPRGDDDQWRDVAERLAATPSMLASWRAGLAEGLRRDLPAARRQAIETAAQADRYAAGTHDELVAGYGDGSLEHELATAAAQAHAGYAELARYLREDYAPRAAEADAVGAGRYAVEARLHLGADVDLEEAYEYGWAELGRIEAELAAEAHRVSPGATPDEAAAILDRTACITGTDAYHAWLRDHHDQAIGRLDGALFDIPGPLRTLDVVLARGSTSGAPYYTPPSEDLTRPGRTWWPPGGRQRFTVWRELTSVFHEGVPGHHLQIGTVMTASDTLSRFAKTTHVFAHSEGWALYAERLADELGWYADEPGTRLGMLQASALRAARVVIDIGLHLGLPLPDGSRWNFEKACEVLRDRGRAGPHMVHPEVVRYCAWPAQAITFKLGERAWLAARDAAARRPGFDARRWHAAALGLGPIGLAGMASMLRGVWLSVVTGGPMNHSVRRAAATDAAAVGQLLYDFNREFDEPTPAPAALADRMRELIEVGDTVVMLGGDGPDAVAVLRFRPAIWSSGLECYLAEMYVTPGRRGQGLGRAVMEASIREARDRGADTMDIGVDEPDHVARRLYESLGFSNRTGGSDGDLMFVYEREL